MAKTRTLWCSTIQTEYNVLSQYDAWYQQFVKQWCEIPDFQEYWEKARESARQEDTPPKIFLARMATTGKLLPIRVQHMLVSVSSKIYPAVSALFRRRGGASVLPRLTVDLIAFHDKKEIS